LAAVSVEVKKEIELEIAYVLFVDIVGYSKLVTSEVNIPSCSCAWGFIAGRLAAWLT
jgi:hypothetical protein